MPRTALSSFAYERGSSTVSYDPLIAGADTIVVVSLLQFRVYLVYLYIANPPDRGPALPPAYQS